MVAPPPPQDVPLREKLAYGAGECGVLCLLAAATLPVFWMRPAGFSSPAALAPLATLLAGGVILDPLMGLIADRTLTRTGRCRPWLGRMAVLLAGFGLAALASGYFGPEQKPIWGCTLGLLFVLVSGMVHVAYSALGPMLSWDHAERTGLASARFASGFLVMAAFVLAVSPLRRVFGGGFRGYEELLGWLALAASVPLFVAFFGVQERVEAAWADLTPVAQDLADLAGNGPWRLLCLILVFLAAAFTLHEVAAWAAFEFLLQRPDLLPLFHFAALTAAAPGVLVSAALTARWGRRSALLLCLLGVLAFSLPLAFVSPRVIAGWFAGETVLGFCGGAAVAVLWGMMTDVSDYSDWIHWRRAIGLICSGGVASVKIGVIAGGWLARRLLGPLGGPPTPDRSELAIGAIHRGDSLVPLLLIGCALACLFSYPLGRILAGEIEDELAGRRVKSGLVVP